MRTLRFLLRKEFSQIFRNKDILRVIFVMPLVQLLVLPWAADYEIKRVHLAVVDHDHSSYSRQMVQKITSSNYFLLSGYNNSYHEALKLVEENKADLILEIPSNFEQTLVKENKAGLFIAVNAINGVKASLGSAYLQTILRDFNQEIRMKWIQFPRFNAESNIEVDSSNWYNPLQDYKYFMVPGILVILVTLVGTFLATLNIVREKEIGTIEQINVTPIKKYHFILGKLIPFWIMGIFILTLGLVVARVAYGIIPTGSLFAIYAFAGIYMLAVLGMGLLVSSISTTQQQAMLISFFFFMVFILLSGLYTPIESMPVWAQWVARLNPVSYFIEVMRMVMLKGSGLADIGRHMLIMTGFAIFLNTWAVISYRKRA